MNKTNNDSKKVFHVKICATLLRILIRISSLLTKTATLYITPSGITISAIDDSQIAMVKLTVQNNAFEKYHATRFKLGLDLDRLKTIINLANPYEIIEMKYVQNRLFVSIEELQTRMGIIDLKNIPDINTAILNASGHSILKSDKLKRGLMASHDIVDSVVLGIDCNKFELRAEKDVNTVRLQLKKEDLIELESAAYFESIYSRKHLQDIIQCLPSESLIRVQFGDRTPLKIDYEFPNEAGQMTYFLMPEVEPL
jgi:DNA polymerase III sliding clamp (beta) subunit (PCNA family)